MVKIIISLNVETQLDLNNVNISIWCTDTFLILQHIHFALISENIKKRHRKNLY